LRPDEVDVPVVAGDLLIGDARILHAAHRNDTDARRTLITLWYQPELSSLPERMQAQMAAKAQAIPEWWPADAREQLGAVRASYSGSARPYDRSLYRPRPLANVK
jgi:FPC/CPF motif-containing protein YcgG